MPDLNEAIENLRSLHGRRTDRDWFAMQAKAGTRRATVRIYDEISWYGTNARSFAQELDDLDVDEIDLRLNSPGGNAWDGVAIFNALRAHPAKVHVTVDGMAASAASAIAMAGDTVRMNRGAQMMIHDASGFAMGNQATMTKTAEWLGQLSDSYADIYAARAGGTADEWRAVMREETWYKAAEAVEAGLADSYDDGSPDPEVTAKASWDLKAYAYAYAGRAAAPAPAIKPRASAPTKTSADPAGTTTKEGAGMDPAKIREALGLAATAPDDEVRTALAAAGLATAPADPDGDDDADAEPVKPVAKAKAKATAPKPGTMTIDVSAWDEQQQRIKALEARAAKQVVEERDKVIADAISEGKFAPARAEHWARLWDADPEGTRTVIGTLAKNVVPVSEFGYAADIDRELDDEFAHLFPPVRKVK